MMIEQALIRLLFVLALAGVSLVYPPFPLSPRLNFLLVAAGGAAMLWVEARMRRMRLPHLIGAALGALFGVVLGAACAAVIGWAGGGARSASFFQLALLMALIFCGVTVGAAKGEAVLLSTCGGFFRDEKPLHGNASILDTSVIIDGRIADIVQTGFLHGQLVIPQFVLRELQMVADSSDPLRRNRGRRGLDIVQRLRESPHVEVRIVEDDFPNVREVDQKLIELAKAYRCKIVTNDFNLNKVAQVQGVPVLNINELTNALKPVVLPGETMRVFVLKEGKEYNQGVAYLDDGTMVVIDNGRKMISKTIEISVTSVLQTTAGKMIFGKFDEKIHGVFEKLHDRSSPATATAAASGRVS